MDVTVHAKSCSCEDRKYLLKPRGVPMTMQAFKKKHHVCGNPAVIQRIKLVESEDEDRREREVQAVRAWPLHTTDACNIGSKLLPFYHLS